jgi:hypothetical protein
MTANAFATYRTVSWRILSHSDGEIRDRVAETVSSNRSPNFPSQGFPTLTGDGGSHQFHARATSIRVDASPYPDGENRVLI